MRKQHLEQLLLDYNYYSYLNFAVYISSNTAINGACYQRTTRVTLSMTIKDYYDLALCPQNSIGLSGIELIFWYLWYEKL